MPDVPTHSSLSSSPYFRHLSTFAPPPRRRISWQASPPGFSKARLRRCQGRRARPPRPAGPEHARPPAGGGTGTPVHEGRPRCDHGQRWSGRQSRGVCGRSRLLTICSYVPVDRSCSCFIRAPQDDQTPLFYPLSLSPSLSLSSTPSSFPNPETIKRRCFTLFLSVSLSLIYAFFLSEPRSCLGFPFYAPPPPFSALDALKPARSPPCRVVFFLSSIPSTPT